VEAFRRIAAAPEQSASVVPEMRYQQLAQIQGLAPPPGFAGGGHMEGLPLASSLTVHTPFTSVGPRVSHDVDVGSGPFPDIRVSLVLVSGTGSFRSSAG
jgi:hypothetical protein